MRKLAIVGVISGLASFSVVGCGGDEGGGGGTPSGPPAMAGTVNAASANTSVQSTSSLSSAVASGDGASMSSAAMGISVSAMSIVQPGSPSAGALTAALTVAATGMETGTKTCDTSGCTFDKYNSGNSNGGTITGSVKATEAGEGAKKVVWNLTVENFGTGSSQLTSPIYKMTGNLMISATKLEGSASGLGTATVQGQQNIKFEYGSVVKYNAITLADKCPTAGSVYAKTWYQVVGAPAGAQQANQAWEGTHTFNGCQR